MSFMDGLDPIRENFRESKRLSKLRKPPPGLLPYVITARDNTIQSVEDADEGERNNAVYQAAATLAGFFPDGHLDEHDTRQRIVRAATGIGLDEREANAAIDSGFERGRQDPVTIPEQTEVEDVSYYDKLKQASLTVDMLNQLPRPTPIVFDTLFRNTVAFLIGPPGNGKSFVAVDLMGCVATGREWNSRTVKQGTVLYGVFEGASGMRQRVGGWQTFNQDRMTRAVFFTPEAAGLRPPQLGKADEWKEFVRYAATEVKPDLIVLDTFNRMSIGLNENAAEEMSQAMERLDRLKTATGACVLVIHHTRKLDLGHDGIVRLDDMRGSGSLAGAAETVLAVTKDEAVVTVHCVKQKDVETFQPFSLELVPAPDRYNKALSHHEADTKETMVDKVLRRWWEAFEDEHVSPTNLDKARVVDSATFLRLRKYMVDRGHIVESGNGTRRTYRMMKDEDQDL